MRKVLIVTDSCSDLTYNKSGDNLFVVPFYIYYKGYGQILQRDTFYNGKRNIMYRDADVVTNGCSYNELFNVLNYAVDNDMDVICLHSAKAFNMSNSKTFEVAVKEFKKSNPNLNVACIDSGNLSYALGLLVEDIRLMSNDGASFEDILDYIRRNRHLYTLEFIMDNHEYLKNYYGTRWLDRLMLNCRNISPVFTIMDGKIQIAAIAPDLLGKVDTLLEDYITTADMDHKVVITHSNNLEAANIFNELVHAVKEDDVSVVESSRVTESIIKAPALGLAYKKRTSR